MTNINASIIRVTATSTDKDIIKAVELASGAERLNAYNQVTGKATKKFSTKAAGIKQTTKAMIAERDRLAAEAPAPKAKPKPETSDDLSNRLGKAIKKRRTGGGARHDPSKYRSAYVKDQLLAGRTDLDAIKDECQERFPDVKTDRKHVTWYRWQLRKAGHDV